MYGLDLGSLIMSAVGSRPIASMKLPLPTRTIISPIRSLASPCSSQNSQTLLMKSLSSANGASIGMNGTTIEDRSAPCTIGAFAPMSMDAPFSLPGRSAFGITFMQCMQRLQLLLSIESLEPSQDMQPVGHFPTTSEAMLTLPPLAYSATAASSCWISSFQVPIIEKSERAIEATQSFGHPAIFILNLYGKAGLCSSSWYSFVRSWQSAIESMHANSQRAMPLQQDGVLMSEPEPPRSQPCSERSVNISSSWSVLVPSMTMSPVEPCMFVRPEPCFSQRSQRYLSELVL